MFETPPLAEVQRFALAMSSSVPAVEDTLPDLLGLLRTSGRPFRIVGGVAVIHHGYVRSTRDLDVLVTSAHGLDALASTFGFERVGATRLSHRSGTLVVLLMAGTPSLRPGETPYPEPWELDPSPRDPEVVGLVGLVNLKLAARRARATSTVRRKGPGGEAQGPSHQHRPKEGAGGRGSRSARLGVR